MVQGVVMSTKSLISCLAILLILTSCQPIPQARPLEENPQVDQIFAAYDKEDSPGCAVGVIQNGQWVYQHAFGMADIEANKPMTTKNALYIGSNGKQFTAMSILLLLEQGKLSIDDDIHTYLPELPDYGYRITVENLVHHTSGIKDYLVLWLKEFAAQGLNGYEHIASIHEGNSLELIASQKELDFAPGDQYAYSNSNYFLLGVIVERVSGMSLRQFAAENIFKPLGMTHTQYKDDINITIPDLAVGNMFDDYGSRMSTRQVSQDYHLVGDGGLYTTLDDLFNWDQNFYHNRLGKKDPHLIDRMYSTQMLNDGKQGDYGFGLGIYAYHDMLEIEHGGGFIGYRSDIARFPEQKLTVIELCNFSSNKTSEVMDLTPQVVDIFLEE
jgi:CubicO group peptidase (beta-lactamase class C family)